MPALNTAVADVAVTRREMYAALKTNAPQAFHAAARSDFFTFDGGRRFDGEAPLALIEATHDRGDVFEWQAVDPRIEVACNVALVTYVNTGSLSEAGTRRALSWLESTTLVHDSQRWRIRFFHVTRVP